MPTILLLFVLQAPVTVQTQVTGSAPRGSIAGRVRNHVGEPLAGAVVSLGMAQQARADSLGRFRLDSVPVGGVEVTVWAYRYQTLRQNVQVKAGVTDTTDFFLDPMPTGLIPAGGARADSIGQYHVDSVPTGAAKVTARCVGFYGASVDTVMTAGQQLRLDFALKPDTLKLGP